GIRDLTVTGVQTCALPIWAEKAAGQTPGVSKTARVSDEAATPVILVADDSITTRTLEKNILEAAGYRVRVAADGAEAWTVLQSRSEERRVGKECRARWARQ